MKHSLLKNTSVQLMACPKSQKVENFHAVWIECPKRLQIANNLKKRAN